MRLRAKVVDMRAFLMVLALMVSGLVAGCQQPQRDSLAATGTEGLLDSTEQRNRRIRYVDNVHTRMLVDDWDTFWLYDRSTKLTPFIVHVGRR